MNVKPGLAMRDQPSLGVKKISEISFDTTIQIVNCVESIEEILGLSGPWCEIKFLDQKGWVFSPFLKTEYSRELAFKISYGKTMREFPPFEPAPIENRLILYRMSIQGHDIGTLQFVLDEKLGKGKLSTCTYWSGPPHTEESSQRSCNTEEVNYRRDKDNLIINGESYKWDGRFKGFIPLDEKDDWKEIFVQAFEGKKHPDGEHMSWVLDEDSCRFYEGDSYGGAQANYLCEKKGFDNSCLCFEK
ncbi:SH3 domain-containing protein [Leptospira interrogans]|uniref:SH3 domain-containing protein n=1 Tax=Leptospira interrogans TaxID=173 RepID=UPI000B0B79AE|nr:SH3 domain-containing protein [Leptospira interrogans]